MRVPPVEETHALDFPFHGQVVAFAGKLASLGQREACDLVERLGGVAVDDVTDCTTMLVVGTATPGGAGGLPREVARSLKLRKAEQANAKVPGRVRILPEEGFCRLGGLPSIEALERQYHSLRQIRGRYPAVREDHLRYLEKWSLVHPAAHTKTDCYYRFQDLLVIRQVSEDLERGVSFRVVLRALVAGRDGQLTLDFSQRRGEAHPVKVIALASHSASGAVPKDVPEVIPSLAVLALAEQYFHEGVSLDEGNDGERERARRAYRKSLRLNPNLVPALINLANIYYAQDELVEAQALYERAMRLDDECFEAYFNLGNIHHDLGRYFDALDHYRIAVEINPDYQDGHFYLAVTLEKIGHSVEARVHWLAYRDLATAGEWVELAREFSEGVGEPEPDA
jgi:tetratricopeptide (TPR) repeat protein